MPTSSPNPTLGLDSVWCTVIQSQCDDWQRERMKICKICLNRQMRETVCVCLCLQWAIDYYHLCYREKARVHILLTITVCVCVCVNTGAAYVEEGRGLQGGDQPSVTLATVLQCQHSVCVRDEDLNEGKSYAGGDIETEKSSGWVCCTTEAVHIAVRSAGCSYRVGYWLWGLGRLLPAVRTISITPLVMLVHPAEQADLTDQPTLSSYFLRDRPCLNILHFEPLSFTKVCT